MSKLAKFGGSALLVTGASMLGVGLGGEHVAAAFPDSGIAAGVGNVAASINAFGDKAVDAVGLTDKISGKTAAALAGGALAAAGVTTVLASGSGKSKEELSAEEQAKDAAYRMRMNEVREAEMGRDLNGDGIIGAVPRGKDSDRNR